MQNSNQQNNPIDHDPISPDNEDEWTEDELESQRKEQVKRRIKARNQFRSPWFILGVIFILFMVIYPRCTYKDNVKKELERKAQNTSEIQKTQPLQQPISDEEQGMVPKF